MIKKVGFIVIGDEMLNGKTADKNINFLAKSLDDYGFDLVEVRVMVMFLIPSLKPLSTFQKI